MARLELSDAPFESEFESQLVFLAERDAFGVLCSCLCVSLEGAVAVAQAPLHLGSRGAVFVDFDGGLELVLLAKGLRLHQVAFLKVRVLLDALLDPLSCVDDVAPPFLADGQHQVGLGLVGQAGLELSFCAIDVSARVKQSEAHEETSFEGAQVLSDYERLFEPFLAEQVAGALQQVDFVAPVYDLHAVGGDVCGDDSAFGFLGPVTQTGAHRVALIEGLSYWLGGLLLGSNCVCTF